MFPFLSTFPRDLLPPAHSCRPQTAPTAPGTEPRSKYDYNYRRQLIREMCISRAQRYRHIAIKFVVGLNPDPVKHASMLDEHEKYGDILLLPMNGTARRSVPPSRGRNE